MSKSDRANQMQQELQNELSTTNQLLRLISMELRKIKQFTDPGGDFDINIDENTSLIKTLANLQQVDLDKIPSFTRKQNDLTTSRDDTEMDNS